MYLAGFIVASSLVAGVYAVACAARASAARYHRAGLVDPARRSGAGGAGADRRRRLGGAHGRRGAADRSWRRSRASTETTDGAGLTIGGVYVDGRGLRRESTMPDAALAARLPRPRTPTVEGLDAVPADGPARRSAVVRNSFQVMVGIGTFLAAARRLVPLVALAPGRRCRRRAGSYRAVVAAGPPRCVALIAGWIVTEVGRQPWIVYELMRTEEAVTGADGHPGRLRDARGRLHRRWHAVALFMLLRRLAREGARGRAPQGRRAVEVLP